MMMRMMVEMVENDLVLLALVEQILRGLDFKLRENGTNDTGVLASTAHIVVVATPFIILSFLLAQLHHAAHCLGC